MRALPVLLSLPLLVGVSACGGSEGGAEQVLAAGQAIRGQVQVMRLVVAADRRSVPPVPTLLAALSDASDELASAADQVDRLPQGPDRANLRSIVDEAGAVTARLGGEVGDGDDSGLDEIQRRLDDLVARLDRMGTRA